MKTPMESLLQSLADRLEPVARAAGVGLFVRSAGGYADEHADQMAEGAFELARHAIGRAPRGGFVVLETRLLADGAQTWHVYEGSRLRRDRTRLAAVRVIADEVERSLEGSDAPDGSLRAQLAEELEHLAASLRAA